MPFYSKLLSTINGISHTFLYADEPPPKEFLRAKQVHGDLVLCVEENKTDDLSTCAADGLFTQTPGQIVAVQTADCLPVLIANGDARAVAAVHAGWKGLTQGILLKAVERFTAKGFAPETLSAAIGPSIRSCCFETGPEVIECFEKNWGMLWNRRDSKKPWAQTQPHPSSTPMRTQAPAHEGKFWLDLQKIATLQLVSVGIDPARIEQNALCTYCGNNRLASYRLSGGSKKRQWSFIAIAK